MFYMPTEESTRVRLLPLFQEKLRKMKDKNHQCIIVG
jgi:hypothetical protein